MLNSTPAGATIDSETWYTWGGSVTVIGSSDGQELDLTVSGKPLALVGQQVVESIDSDSIKRNGSRYLSIEDNRLIQGVITSYSIHYTKLYDIRSNILPTRSVTLKQAARAAKSSSP